MQRDVSGTDHPDDRDPGAGRARPALPPVPRPRRLRARADGRPRRRRSRSRSASSRREPPLKRTSTCPRWASSLQRSSAASCGPSWTSTSVGARAVAARDDEIDELYHRTFDEVVALMRADPDNVERGTRILFAAHTSSGSATGSRTSPRTSCSSPAARSRTSTHDSAGTGRSGSSSCAPATAAARSWPRRCSASSAGIGSRSHPPGASRRGRSTRGRSRSSTRPGSTRLGPLEVDDRVPRTRSSTTS